MDAIAELEKNQALANDIMDDLVERLDDKSIILPDYLAATREEDIRKPDAHLLRVMRQPENFWFTCHHLFDIRLLPYQTCILEELWVRPFPLLIGSRGIAKSMLLGLYAMLRSLFTQGSRIVITGAGFRQAKIVFEHAEHFWAKGHLFRDIVGSGRGRNNKEMGPSKATDKWSLTVGESEIVALPLGDGQKVRGQRATHLLEDEFNSIPIHIHENVLQGFNIVAADPYKSAMARARERLLKKRGLWSKEQEELAIQQHRTNQTVLSGTPGYEFQHFCKYWKKYKAIIESGGDAKTLKEIHGGNPEPGFNYKNYSIIRLPYNCVPQGVMQDEVIAQSRASTHSSNFRQEYGACFLKNTQVVTDSGNKIIFDVKPGDRVLTHKGRWREVLKKTYRWHGQPVVHISTARGEAGVTLDHPFWAMNENFRRLSELVGIVYHANFRAEKSDGVFDLRKYCINYLEKRGRIYSCGKAAFSGDRQRWMQEAWSNRKDTYQTLSKAYGVPPSTIKRLYEDDYKLTKSLPALLPLGEELGIFLGCFAAGGRIRQGGKAISFPSHVADLLWEPCARLFGRRTKITSEGAFIYDRLLPEMLDKVCPRKTKGKGGRTILIDVAFQSESFIRGFLKGTQRTAVVPAMSPLGQQIYLLQNALQNTDHTEIPLTSERLADYQGLVYNLEVEEDNSFTLACGATVHNCFSADSDGFFKRSLIESCVVGKPENPIVWQCGLVNFNPVLRGESHSTYVIGVDAAAIRDNFAIVIIELCGDHRRIVYSWTIRKDFHKKRVEAGLVKEHDFYGYCARKIRELMAVFPTSAIVMDAQGGGFAVSEALHDPERLHEGEQPIWEYIDYETNKEKPTDKEPGIHCLYLIEFANGQWVAEANHGMRKDFEGKTLLFPNFDEATIGLAEIEDDKSLRIYDTMEDCVQEIEELKDELSSIVVTVTPNGREHWDTPAIKTETGKVGRLRKDRYSALLMANGWARKQASTAAHNQYVTGHENNVGGMAVWDRTKTTKQDGPLYTGAGWFRPFSD